MSERSEDNEHRHFTRIPFDADVEVRRTEEPDSMPRHARLLDICLKGALFTRPADWNGRAGDRVHVEIRLDDAAITIAMDGRVVHAGDERVGFTWDQLDVDSATHLHRLLELNLGDSALLEREFHELLNFTPR
ncbi:MAG TPA: PilZ domain-containing protein [Gammaproteobacteria bacterium]|nr:PilZ domain-containing protein [Gammaproteobacteria bacterium]